MMIEYIKQFKQKCLARRERKKGAMKMKSRSGYCLVVLIAMSLVLSACGGGQKPAAPQGAAAPTLTLRLGHTHPR